MLKLGLLFGSLALLAYVLYFHRLGTLLPGYNSLELQSLHGATDWHKLVQDPINSPYIALVWLLTAVLHHGVLVTRIVAACFGIIAVMAFFLVARLRFNYWVALTGTLLFATSSGVLHTTRLGTAQILQLGILVLLALVLMYRRYRSHRVALGYLTAVACGILLYVPGLIWFEVLGIILLWLTMRRHRQPLPGQHAAAWVGIFLACATPLVIASISHPQLLLDAGGLPHNVDTLTNFGVNVLHTLMSLAVRSNGSPVLWVGHAPLLNVVELVLLTIGLYSSAYVHQGFYSRLLLATGFLGVVLVSLGGGVAFICLVPVIYLLICEGFFFLLQQWFAVFPRNPVARLTGICLVTVMLSFSVLYQGRLYFVAWPHNPAVRHEFSHHN